MKYGLQFASAEYRNRLRRYIANTFSPLPTRGWSDIRINISQEVSSDQDLIVLINSQTRSAGEYFIWFLRQLDNVTFIGSNTRGSLLTGGFSAFSLNNSGIRVGVGTSLNFEPDLKNREGRGYLPDYWLEFPDDLESIDFNKFN